MERSRLQQWLCFIGTELHKGLFTPLLGKNVPAEVKAYTLEKYLSRLDYLDGHLKGRQFLLDHVRGLCREDSLAVLWATHLIDEVDEAGQVIVLHEGRVLAAGATPEVRRRSGDAVSMGAAFDTLTRRKAA